MSRQDDLASLVHEKLSASRADIAAQWRQPAGTHTRHFIVDDLLPPDICARIYAAFPKDADGFYNRASFREKKKTSANLDAYDPILADITYALQAPRIVGLIADTLQMQALEPDPQLYAGGLSMMFQGDFLNPHIDNSHDAARQRYRRLNLLYYVSPDWRLESGGNFEMWDPACTTARTVVAAANRLLVMETNRRSWHSVSPLKAAGPRCCVSSYYFSAHSPDQGRYFHVTSFTGRPREKLRRAWGVVDNALRNMVSRTLRVGRGKDQVNRTKR